MLSSTTLGTCFISFAQKPFISRVKVCALCALCAISLRADDFGVFSAACLVEPSGWKQNRGCPYPSGKKDVLHGLKPNSLSFLYGPTKVVP
jgi:hypothetical protein